MTRRLEILTVIAILARAGLRVAGGGLPLVELLLLSLALAAWVAIACSGRAEEHPHLHSALPILMLGIVALRRPGHPAGDFLLEAVATTVCVVLLLYWSCLLVSRIVVRVEKAPGAPGPGKT